MDCTRLLRSMGRSLRPVPLDEVIDLTLDEDNIADKDGCVYKLREAPGDEGPDDHWTCPVIACGSAFSSLKELRMHLAQCGIYQRAMWEEDIVDDIPDRWGSLEMIIEDEMSRRKMKVSSSRRTG